MVPAKFLNKYDNILIELDGTLISDKYLYICAMLSVYELCNSRKYFGKADIDYATISHNRNQISELLLCSNKTLALLSEHGIDNPIDVAYAMLSVILGIGERRDFNNIYNYFKYIDTPDIFDHLSVLLIRALPGRDCKPDGEIYNLIKKCYNEWLFGDEFYEIVFEETPSAKGKISIITSEPLLLPLNNIRDILSTLISSGKNLSLYTLRSKPEVKYILEKHKLLQFFSTDNIVTLDDIVESGHEPNINTTLDSDPYGMVRAIVGSTYNDGAFQDGEYAEVLSKSIVISNSPITLFASQISGISFAATVVDPLDKSAKDMFRQLEADYVISSLNDLLV